MSLWWSVAEIKCGCDYLSAWSNVRDKMAHQNLSRPYSQNLSLIASSILSAKQTVTQCIWRVFLCVTCHFLAFCFCFCYGEVVLKSQWEPLSKLLRNAYVLYFGCKVGDQDKVPVPMISYTSCSRTLTRDG